ncbi:hypothetical protein DXG01_008164 [Tephrocybe rancida]|nr:hypothetical protein DXG01_008164 [Tephrocybe rancida]
MKLGTIPTLVVFYIYATTCHAATITLFQVATTTVFASPSRTFTPIGVGADGATTYSGKEVASVYVVIGPPPEPVTINGTILSTASTHFETTFTSDPLLIHGASGFMESHQIPSLNDQH